MKQILTTSLVSLSILALSACNSSDNKSNSNQTHSTVTTPSTTVTPPSTVTPTVTSPVSEVAITTSKCDTFGSSITGFERVQMHYGLLRNKTYLTGESGGVLPLTVTSDAQAGSKTINVDSTTALVSGQLITYLGENQDYYVAEIASLTSNTITLTDNTAIVSKVSAGTNAWNFYEEPFKANHFGQKALADLSYRQSAAIVNTGSTHVVIGDSWLNDAGYTDRLKRRYPSANIINNTGTADGLCDLLADFDKDVTANAPQYVWIASSKSDYNVGVSQEEYKLRLQDLVAKVQGIGATAIVFDSVSGSANISADGVVNSETLAHRYSSQVFNLYNDAKTVTTEPVVDTPAVTPPVTTPVDTPVVTPPVSTPIDTPVVTPPVTTPIDTASCSATAESITSFTRVEMHYGLLGGQGFVPDANGQAETRGLATYDVANAVSAGSSTIDLASTDGLVTGQLITYLTTNAVYRVARIKSLTPTQITLASGVVANVNAGQTLWNFYDDPTHPNSVGLSAVADHGYAFVSGLPGVNEATHVLLGDSWFTNDGFEERVRTRLPNANIINVSTGGNTLCNLLNEFDSTVAPQEPDYVWIHSSVNDYFNNVSQGDYANRMQNLIAKVQSTGAVAVVLDSAPAEGGTLEGGSALNSVSQSYAFQIQQLFNDANNQ